MRHFRKRVGATKCNHFFANCVDITRIVFTGGDRVFNWSLCDLGHGHVHHCERVRLNCLDFMEAENLITTGTSAELKNLLI